ncbi:peptidoglycan DD-metalloendopeptidase family protein [Paraburkholderia silviterrae]|uniref:LysM peptidoglycan-binding domain-containing protein n=1 Tax=Paraburkholderia silviterrae TaxID=2528715 RepID=A0A4R5ME99_9BURK|nr:peptidoglycan DD-metalloendopeptidase family protein [Paraburkholderia silviterrae]TDG25458.1 LysM peptidoglycan-binding domain-containing protein [Paraburkholderia silviterrae]
MSMLRAMQRKRLNIDLTAARNGASVIALCLLTACATRLDNAPVVDRTAPLGAAGAQPAVPLGPPPPGYYRVKPGDTLYRIALENGQNFRDISAWNNLTNPNQIEVDQLLRVVPPGASNGVNTPGVVAVPAPGSQAAMPPMYGSGASATSVPPVAAVPPQASGGDMAAAPGSLALAWPVRGPVLNSFDDSKNKGINIGGATGEAVKAAGDGRVVYAGNGLRGYGNLIIIKHDATFLTAYAHNRALMVKEGDAVTKGQKIAEMGNTDSDRVMLHFEVRRQGKPVDPLKYLPPQ